MEDYLVCRCEDVWLSEVTQCLADAEGAAGAAEIKRRLRVGMGWCQGRVCGPVLAKLTGTSELLERHQIVRPVFLAQIATESHEPAGE